MQLIFCETNAALTEPIALHSLCIAILQLFYHCLPAVCFPLTNSLLYVSVKFGQSIKLSRTSSFRRRSRVSQHSSLCATHCQCYHHVVAIWNTRLLWWQFVDSAVGLVTLLGVFGVQGTFLHFFLFLPLLL